MKVTEIRTLSIKDLEEQLEKAYEELFNFRLRAATKQLANHREIPRVRRRIARIKTILREKELDIRQV